MVKWHDGVPTTAGDAAWTLEQARDPRTGYPRLADLATLASVRADDDTTLTLAFSEPPPVLPDVLTDLAILPRHLLDTVPPGRLREAAFNEHPVGNGPFRFVTHEPNRRWVFAADSAFPAELGGPPAIRRFIVVVVDEPTTKLAALTSGELDFAGIQPAHASFVAQDDRLAVLSYPLLFTYGIVLDTREPPFDVPSVRRALSLALDRHEIVDGYLYGFGTPASGGVPPDAPGALPGAAPRMMSDSARALLRGARPRFELLTVGSGEAALEQMIQAQLARAGFEVTIRQLELSAFLDRVYGPRREFEAAVLGIPGDLSLGYLPPLVELAGMQPPGTGGPIQQLLSDSLPVVFLYHARGLQGMSRRIGNVRMDLRGELAGLAEWRIE
jgi:peptide/nickel transport system substrate-binding protein